MTTGKAAQLVELYRRAAYRARRLVFPREPWLAPAAIRFLRRRLLPQHFVLEWGSGESTIWYAKRAAGVLAVESDEAWFERVADRIEEEGLRNIDLRYCHWISDGLPPGDFRDGGASEYVLVAREVPDESCDWVVVDGVGREACVLAGLSKVRPGGFLVVDNTDYRSLRDWRVPSDWPLRLRSPYAATETSIWQRPEEATEPGREVKAL